MSRLLVIIFIIFITSCNEIEFVYKENKGLINPLYGITEVSTSGLNINFMKSYLSMFFGEDKESLFNLLINVEQEKTKTSVETNQAVSKLRYELKFTYTLVLNKEKCVTFSKDLLTYFSIIPKSSVGI